MLPASNTIRIIRPQAGDRLIDFAELAVEQSLHLITNGSDMILCSIIPVGWRKFHVKFKPAPPVIGLPMQWLSSPQPINTLSHQENYGTSEITPVARIRV